MENKPTPSHQEAAKKLYDLLTRTEINESVGCIERFLADFTAEKDDALTASQARAEGLEKKLYVPTIHEGHECCLTCRREIAALQNDIKEAYEDRQEAVNDRDAALLKCEQLEKKAIDESHALAIAWESAEAETIRPWRERVLSLENQYRHVHQASYITQGDKDILTEICNECGRNLRDELHAPESSHLVPNKGESA